MLCFNIILIFEPRKAEKLGEVRQQNGGQMMLRLALATAAVGQWAYEKRGKYSKKSSWRVKMAYCRPIVVPFR